MSDVTLSTDLAQHLLASLDAVHCRARQVCTVWRDALDAGDDGRRGLKPPAEVLTPDFFMHPAACVAAFPSGYTLVVGHHSSLRVVDRSMHTVLDLRTFIEMPTA